MQAAVDATHEMNQRIVEKEEGYKQICIDGGMTVITEENGLDLASFNEAAETVYDYFSDDWGDMIELIQNVESE